MVVNRDAIGVRGEAIITNLLTRRHGRDEPLFRPQFLGEKYPTIDFFVELVGVTGNQTPFFLVQVKATAIGYTRAGRLRVRMTTKETISLVRYPAPTYVIGVDEDRELGFLVAAVLGGLTQYRSLPTIHALADFVTLQTLYDQVQSFWRAHPASFDQSRFR